MNYYIVDAFTSKLFSGNPAGVCILDKWLDDCLMQSIASENNLSETAFLVKNDMDYDLRWFTPKSEIDLCGHATLGTAYIISNFIDKDIEIMNFNTKSGTLSVKKKDDLYELDFPSRKPAKIEITPLMRESINSEILEAHISRDLLLLLKNEEEVKNLNPNFHIVNKIPEGISVVVTAKGNEVDFVSRFFAPKLGILEDPVTGSAHSTLIPFWAEKLNKDKMIAHQISERKGELYCENCGDRVKISGKAALYLKGEIFI